MMNRNRLLGGCIWLLIFCMGPYVKGETLAYADEYSLRDVPEYDDEGGEESSWRNFVDSLKSEIYSRFVATVGALALFLMTCLVFGVSMEISNWFIHKWGMPSFISYNMLCYGSLIISVVTFLVMSFLDTKNYRKEKAENGESPPLEEDILEENANFVSSFRFLKVLFYSFCYGVNISNVLLLLLMGLGRVLIRGRSFDDRFHGVTVNIGNGDVNSKQDVVILNSLLKWRDRGKEEWKSDDFRERLGFSFLNTKYGVSSGGEKCCLCSDPLGDGDSKEVVVHGNCAGGCHVECLAEWVREGYFLCPCCGLGLSMEVKLLGDAYRENSHVISDERKALLRNQNRGGERALLLVAHRKRMIRYLNDTRKRLLYEESDDLLDCIEEFYFLLNVDEEDVDDDDKEVLEGLERLMKNGGVLGDSDKAWFASVLSQYLDLSTVTNQKNRWERIGKIPVFRHAIDLGLRIFQ